MDGNIRQTELADQLARAGVITHLLRIEPEEESPAAPALEEAALAALCDVSVGPVFRIGPLEYGFSTEAGEEDELRAIADSLAARIFGDQPGGVTLSPVAPAGDAPALDRIAVLLLDRLGSAALQAAGPEGSAVIDAGYAVAAARLAAEEIGALVDRVGERVRAIIPAPAVLPRAVEGDRLSAEIESQRGLLEEIRARLDAQEGTGAAIPDPVAARLAELEERVARMPGLLLERIEAALAPPPEARAEPADAAALERRLAGIESALADLR
ncbi:MAG: hypothetical protein D6686_04885, partial [Alphaproteobacteria bacterium]